MIVLMVDCVFLIANLDRFALIRGKRCIVGSPLVRRRVVGDLVWCINTVLLERYYYTKDNTYF